MSSSIYPEVIAVSLEVKKKWGSHEREKYRERGQIILCTMHCRIVQILALEI